VFITRSSCAVTRGGTGYRAGYKKKLGEILTLGALTPQFGDPSVFNVFAG